MLFSILLTGFVRGSMDKTKTFSESFSVSAETHLKVKNNCGPIEFRTTTGNEAKVEATLFVEGETLEEIEKVINQFELRIAEAGDKIDVIAEDNVKNWVQVNALFVKKNTITFNDGKEAYGITKMEVGLVVYLPEVERLSVYNKYDDVKYDILNCDVDVEMFSGDFNGGDILGDLDMNLKYGDISIGNIEDGDFNLFDCDVNVENAKEINLNVKYSDVEFEDVYNCVMQSFDDEIKFNNITEEFKLDAKYSNINIGNFKKADFELFDCDLIAKDGQEVELESKYGTHKLGDVGSLSIDFFQDDLSVGDISELRAGNIKYSSIDIDKVMDSFNVLSSFQDDIEVGFVGSKIDRVELSGKYTDLEFPIPSDVSYYLDADLRYSTFVFPDSCKKGDEDNGDQNYSIDCEVKNPGENSLKVKLNIYDGDIILK